MTNTELILLSIGTVVFFVFGYRYVSKLQMELEYKKIPLTVVIEKTSTGYSAYCKEIDGIIAVEENIPALKEQFHEAFVIMLNYQDEMQGEYADMYPSDFEITYVEE